MDPGSIVAGLSAGDRAARRRAVAADLSARGVTFDGRVFDIGPVPRVIPGALWDRLAAGVEQRARALDLFLGDVYAVADPAAAEIVRAGRMDADVVRRAPGYTALGSRVPAGTVRTRVTGADLVSTGEGTELSDWVVLEDNVRMPSGLTFAVAAREVTAAHWPELYAAAGDRLRPLDGVTERFCAALRDAAGDLTAVPGVDPASAHVVVATAGEHDPSWSEQRVLASVGGFALRSCDDLVVGGGPGPGPGPGAGSRSTPVLWDRVADRRVDVVYLRVTEDRLPAGTGDAVAAGTVVIVDAPGNGLADDKAVYASVPEMVRFYLGEEPVLGQVPTWLCADPAQCPEVLDRLGELVVKPVDGYGGAGITVGPECTGEQLAARREEILGHPERFVAQERVELSTLPASDGTDRHVDLRMFSLLGRDGAATADAGLTRVAPAGSTVVNSSRGGGGRDTWILDDGPGPGHLR